MLYLLPQEETGWAIPVPRAIIYAMTKDFSVMVNGELVHQLDYNTPRSIGFCEICIGEKHHYAPFDSSSTQSRELLELVYSDYVEKLVRSY